MLKSFKCVTGTPQGKAYSSQRICSCFSFFSPLISPIQFSILFLTLWSAKQITGILCEPLVSFWFLHPSTYWEYFREKFASDAFSKILGTDLKQNASCDSHHSQFSVPWAFFWNVSIVLLSYFYCSSKNSTWFPSFSMMTSDLCWEQSVRIANTDFLIV